MNMRTRNLGMYLAERVSPSLSELDFGDDEAAMVMEEDCTAAGKITGFNKMIGAEMKAVNAEAKIISKARKEAGKDKQQLHKDAAKITAPQASCAAQE